MPYKASLSYSPVKGAGPNKNKSPCKASLAFLVSTLLERGGIPSKYFQGRERAPKTHQFHYDANGIPPLEVPLKGVVMQHRMEPFLVRHLALIWPWQPYMASEAL